MLPRCSPQCSLDTPSKAALLPFLDRNGNPQSYVRGGYDKYIYIFLKARVLGGGGTTPLRSQLHPSVPASTIVRTYVSGPPSFPSPSKPKLYEIQFNRQFVLCSCLQKTLKSPACPMDLPKARSLHSASGSQSPLQSSRQNGRIPRVSLWLCVGRGARKPKFKASPTPHSHHYSPNLQYYPKPDS